MYKLSLHEDISVVSSMVIWHKLTKLFYVVKYFFIKQYIAPELSIPICGLIFWAKLTCFYGAKGISVFLDLFWKNAQLASIYL